MQYCSDNTTELAKALIQVQIATAPAPKDGKNPFTKSNYATLNSVMESCRAALLDNGIWLTQLPVPAPIELGPGHIGVMTKLTHAETGQWQASLTVVPMPKVDPQGMGSAITYARRYALTAMLGMITEDDDGESAKLSTKPSANSQIATGGKSRPSFSSRLSKQPELEGAVEEIPFEDSALPKLEGVTYQLTTTQDGRQCVMATGNTHPKKEILHGAGFKWNAQRKCWWKYADAS